MSTRLLQEGIEHVDDLDIDEFIAVITNLSKFKAYEKLDGANLWFGLDDGGRFFTSREGKRAGADKKYSVTDWGDRSNLEQFKAAHSALSKVTDTIESVLRPGDTIEAEVLYGEQPNAISYGLNNKSLVALLRGVNDTPEDRVEALVSALSGKTVDVKVQGVSSDDGESLRPIAVMTNFEFVAPQEIDALKIETSEIEAAVKKFQDFLQEPSTIDGMSNGELATVSLNTIDKEKKESVKTARADLLQSIYFDHKLPIKSQLLDKLVRGRKSKVSPEESDSSIEGIVLRDPVSGRQVKIVDKDLFTVLNKFNQSARGRIQSPLRSTDPDSSLESKGGILGEVRIKIADALGNRELAKMSNLRKEIQKVKGADAKETVQRFAASLNVTDFEALKIRSLSIISAASKVLKAELQDFKDNKDQYKLKMKDGTEIKLSGPTIKKTLVAFAEGRESLEKLFSRIKGAANIDEFVAVMYGGVIKGMQENSLKEELLIEKRAVKKKKKTQVGEVDLRDFEGRESFHLINGYLAIVFLTMFIHHVNDVQGMRLLRDRKNCRLTRWSHDMSPFNHWGYMFWRTNRPDVKAVLPNRAEKDIKRITDKLPDPWWKFLHMDFSYSKGVKIDWADHRATLQRIIDLSGLRNQRLNSLLDEAVRWPELTFDEQVKAMNRLYLYAMQFVPRSSLFQRFRQVQTNLVLNPPESILVKESLLKQIALREDDGGGAAAGGDASASPSTGTPVGLATSNSDIASLPSRISSQRTVIKRKRNPAMVMLGFKFKDPRKSK